MNGIDTISVPMKCNNIKLSMASDVKVSGSGLSVRPKGSSTKYRGGRGRGVPAYHPHPL